LPERPLGGTGWVHEIKHDGFRLWCAATAPGSYDYVMMAGGSEVGRVILLPGGYDLRGDWFWCLRDCSASGYAATREDAIAAFARAWQQRG